MQIIILRRLAQLMHAVGDLVIPRSIARDVFAVPVDYDPEYAESAAGTPNRQQCSGCHR